MDFQTAKQDILQQTLPQFETEQTFLSRLRQGQAPVPGQVTHLLLALKVISRQLQNETHFERDLAHALFLLAYESRNLFEFGCANGISWPPLLDADLTRLAIAVHQIFSFRPADIDSMPPGSQSAQPPSTENAPSVDLPPIDSSTQPLSDTSISNLP